MSLCVRVLPFVLCLRVLVWRQPSVATQGCPTLCDSGLQHCQVLCPIVVGGEKQSSSCQSSVGRESRNLESGTSFEPTAINLRDILVLLLLGCYFPWLLHRYGRTTMVFWRTMTIRPSVHPVHRKGYNRNSLSKHHTRTSRMQEFCIFGSMNNWRGSPPAAAALLHYT